MIKRSLVIAGLIAVGSSSAFADISGLTAKFGGGCTAANTSGNCTIKVSATGSGLDGETVLLKHADTQAGPIKKISNRGHDISSGSTSIRFKNLGGCYIAVTGPNGNDKPDATSRKICEK